MSRIIIDEAHARKIQQDYNRGLHARGLMTVTMRHPVNNTQVEVVPVNVLIEHLGLWDDANRKLLLPDGWRIQQAETECAMFSFVPQHGRRLRVLLSATRESDGKLWMCATVSSWSQNWTNPEPPDLNRIGIVKDLFVGPEREAYVVFPAGAKQTDATAYNLWCCLEGPGLNLGAPAAR